ncbi:hypothetical protein WR25_24260 [Diploscapter pachys]|uniref:C3H1-type domain-containing protein n=1 Tax=Diploscapter pachys TaxID=2018661 RepID=A0A2A2LKE3_9BILA|nr:hypothetical protein WR25_24260 [Diploscapter pachys]
MSPIMPPTSLAMQHSPTGTNGSNHSGSQEIGAAAVSPGRRSSEASSIQRPTALGPVEEKQHHLHYLNEFRVEACPLFKQHQCQQHRPFTCFNWHFANQRRRRPIRKPDGSFNYSPDIYCDKYDENTGICPDGDECIYLHRVSGDVERKYHLRYYKTAQCVHATDARGQCVKNGAHCAFAHSSTDLRQPQFDSHETGFSTSIEGEGRDRTSFVVEDPLWHSQDHVLSCYKTEQCRKPARLCRQGYACPFYHNSKDRRRPPAVYKYRSTPCPAAKTVDEWLDPELCEAGDSCQYCHTRTEQQFHPEIYKSTKCNDMLEHGYCPRAVFCAFAHHDSELHVQRTPYVGSSQPSPKEQCSPNGGIGIGLTNGSTTPNYNRSNMQPIAPKSPYASTDLISSSYPKAPGFERGPLSPNSRGMEPLNRLRTHSLNMGHLDMARRQMLTSFGGGDLASGSSLPSHSSLCRSDSGFHAPPLGGLSGQPAMSSITGTLEELSLDLTPIDEQAQNQPRRLSELLGGILSVASPMGVQQGNEGVYPSSPLASYPTECIFSPPTNNRAMISPQQAFGGMAGGFEQQAGLFSEQEKANFDISG